MTPVKALGKAIVTQRTMQGLEQGQLARAARISLNHLKKIEKGRQRTVTLPVLARIAEALGVKTYVLVSMTERMLKRSK